MIGELHTRGTQRNAPVERLCFQEEGLVGAAGIEIASLLSKSNRENGVAPPSHSNWSLLEPSYRPEVVRMTQSRLSVTHLFG